MSYHTKGEEIYWHYHQPLCRVARDKALAEVLSNATGYPLKRVTGSVGGYKAWCIQALKIPAFTVETGKDEFSHPLVTDEAKEDIFSKNERALLALSKAVAEQRGLYFT